MPSSNKPFHAFDGTQKPFGFVCVDCVLKVLLMRNNFQIAQVIVGAVKVFVVYFQSIFNATIKCFPHHAMHASFSVFRVFAKTCDKIVIQQLRLNQSMRCIPSPSFAQLDRMGCGYASAQKLSNLFKGSAVLKHFFSFRNFCGVKSFASGNAPHVSKIADLVQTFKVQNWLPRFHSHTPFNMNGSIA